jgi:hypothetical protein
MEVWGYEVDVKNSLRFVLIVKLWERSEVMNWKQKFNIHKLSFAFTAACARNSTLHLPSLKRSEIEI